MKWNQKVIKRIACKWQLYLLAFYYQCCEFNYCRSFDVNARAHTRTHMHINRLGDKRTGFCCLLCRAHCFVCRFLKTGTVQKSMRGEAQVFRCCWEMIAGGCIAPISVFKVTGEFLLCSQLSQSAHMADGPSSTQLIRLSGSIGLTVDSTNRLPPTYRWSDLRLSALLELLVTVVRSPYVLQKRSPPSTRAVYIVIISADILSMCVEMCFCSVMLSIIKCGQALCGSPLISVWFAVGVVECCKPATLNVLRVLWATTASIFTSSLCRRKVNRCPGNYASAKFWWQNCENEVQHTQFT